MTTSVISQNIIDAISITKNINNESSVQRKKPGRPKKTTVISIGDDIRGIQRQPIDEFNVVEFVYDNPVLIKKIVSLFKSYEAETIDFVFTKNEFRMMAKDHLKTSRIFVDINCKVMNYYYCDEDMKVTVQRDSFEKILSNIEKNQHKMHLFIKAIDKKNKLNIMLHNCKFDIDNMYSIDINLSQTNCIDGPDESKYPVHFILDSKHFKSEIVKISKMTDKIIFQKVGARPLEITFSSNQKINYCGIYNDSSKINLKCTLDDEDILSVAVNLDYIKPYSNVCISEYTNISLSNDSDICFTLLLDRRGEDLYAITAKVFVEIKSAS